MTGRVAQPGVRGGRGRCLGRAVVDANLGECVDDRAGAEKVLERESDGVVLARFTSADHGDREPVSLVSLLFECPARQRRGIAKRAGDNRRRLVGKSSRDAGSVWRGNRDSPKTRNGLRGDAGRRETDASPTFARENRAVGLRDLAGIGRCARHHLETQRCRAFHGRGKREDVDHHDNVRTIADGIGTLNAPVETNLVLGLSERVGHGSTVQTELVRILLKLVLTCEPDAAWDALRSPAVFRAVAAPFTTFESLEPDGFPRRWTAGPHPVRSRAFGIAPMGEQVIDLSFEERPDGVRRVNDRGHGVDGVLGLITLWRHTMAVSATEDGRTLYRDQLVMGAGLLTVPVWLGLWAFWQWRGVRIRALSAGWRA
jgi:hypothetical protein